MGDGQLYDSMLRDGLNDAFSDQASGWHTEDLAAQFQITREAQDQWALRTQQRFGAAQPAGEVKDEILPVELAGRKRATVFGEVERIEINEAFAAIVIAVTRELGLSPDIVNVEGGAIAHGHPIGAMGAVLTTRLIHSMRRDGLKRGMVTLCIGGGQGIALALETMA